MPAYNSEKSIASSILSIFEQSFTNYHLYVVDDGSTDNTVNAIKPFLRTNKLTYIRNESNLGVSVARNVGIEASQGNYIAFCDSDDLWLPNKLEHQVNILDSGRYDVVCSNYYTFTDTPSLTGKIRRANEIINYDDMLNSNWIGNSTGIYNQNKIGKIHQKNIGHEDYLMWLSILEKARNHSAYCIPEPLALYRIAEESLSGNKIKAAHWQWEIYRERLHFPFNKSCILLFRYFINAVIKRAGRS